MNARREAGGEAHGTAHRTAGYRIEPLLLPDSIFIHFNNSIKTELPGTGSTVP